MTTHLEFAIQVAQQAGEFALGNFQFTGTHAELKPDRTVVTEIDLATDQLISDSIRKRYPFEATISEEQSTAFDGDPQAVWIIDPIDGTTNFSLGLQFWGISIARVENGEPALGVIYFPAINEMYAVERGRGAFMNGEPIHVKAADKDRPVAFFTCCTRSHRFYHINVPYKTRILGSAAYALCTVARGVALTGFQATTKVWDIAAGWLLVEEAGGVVDTHHGPLPFPLSAGTNYGQISYPILFAATPDLLAKTRTQILPRKTPR